MSSVNLNHAAHLIFFSPRQGEASDEVHLRGEPKLVAKLKVELEKAAATLRDRVVLGVGVPSSQHRALIGRGGQHLTELQNRTGAQIQFPGSRSYNLVGEPVNTDELTEVNPADLVKVSGSRAACEKAIQELKVCSCLMSHPRLSSHAFQSPRSGHLLPRLLQARWRFLLNSITR